MPRRLLFQAACDFLEALCAHGNKRAQQKLFPYISSILDHMGVQALDVAQVVEREVRDLPSSIAAHTIAAHVRDLPSSSSFWRALCARTAHGLFSRLPDYCRMSHVTTSCHFATDVTHCTM